MSRAAGKPLRRLRLVRTPAADDTTPRVEELDALLREVDQLRLTLETDLTLAASAVEMGAPALAAEIIGNDRAALHGFEDRALARLDDLEAVAPRRRHWANAHAAPIMAAAALVGVLAGVVPQALAPHTDGIPRTVAATDSLERIQQLAQDGDTAQVRAASVQLHAQLAAIVANAKSDPAAAQTALLLLSYEQSAIVRSGDSSVLADVLRQSQALARAIRAALPASARSVVPAPVVVQPTSGPTPKPSASPKASPKPSPKPSATATPAPSGNASPSQTLVPQAPQMP